MNQHHLNHFKKNKLSCLSYLAVMAFPMNTHGHLMAAPQTVVLKDYFFPLIQGNSWTYAQSGFSKDILFEDRVTVTDQNYSFGTPGGVKKSVELQYEYPDYDLYRNYDYLKEYYGKSPDYTIYGFERFHSDEYSYGKFYPEIKFKAPLKVGQSIIQKTNFFPQDGTKYPVTLAIKLIGFEKVAVPAGVFDKCAHLQFTLKSAHAPPSISEEWWAKGVGPVKEKKRGSDKTVSYAKMTSITKKLLGLFNDEEREDVSGRLVSFRDDQGRLKNLVTLELRNLGLETLKDLSVTLSGSDLFQVERPSIGKLKYRQNFNILIHFNGDNFSGTNRATLTITDHKNAKVVVNLSN